MILEGSLGVVTDGDIVMASEAIYNIQMSTFGAILFVSYASFESLSCLNRYLPRPGHA